MYGRNTNNVGKKQGVGNEKVTSSEGGIVKTTIFYEWILRNQQRKIQSLYMTVHLTPHV